MTATRRLAVVILAGLLVILSSSNRRTPAAEGKAAFEERARQAGVARKHTNRAFENPYAQIMQGYTALGAAAAAADYDLDGYEDLFVTDSQKGHPNLLYRNNGDGTFSEVAERARVARGNDAANASADVLWFDYDGDGYPDLLVVRFGQNLLFHNKTDGTFEDVTARSGLKRYLNCVTAIAFDYDLDSDLDLFYGNYFSSVNLFDPDTPRFFPESFETAANGGGLTVFRNDGGGRFTDVTQKVGLVQSGWTLDLGHADADHDGDDDLYVAADFGTDRFYRNNGDGTFTDISETSIGVDTKKGMNTDWADYDGDGLFDIYVTNITDEYMREGNFLWHNNGDLTFSDVARETGTHNTGWGWAGKFFDFDNDTWLDLYVVNGWVSAGEQNYVLDIFEVIVKPDIDLSDARNWPPMGDKTLSGYQHNSLFHNQGGMLFKDVAAEHGLDSLLDGRGVVVADFDNDGRQDLFVTNAGKEPFLFKNTHAGKAHWAQFLLEGTTSNRDAVGARVWVTAGGRTQVSFVNGGNGFASQSSRRLHFGLGGAAAVQKLKVAWPSGLTEEFENIKGNRIYRIVEGAGRLTDFAPGAPGKPGAGRTRKISRTVHADASREVIEGATKVAQSGNLVQALDMYEAALADDPDDLHLGAEYRQIVIEAEAYDRCLEFFEKLVAEHPGKANALLNYAFAYVDKVPVEGAITAVILANTALTKFSEAVEIEESWLSLYSRGNSYMYWPTIFGRAPKGIADLEKAITMSAEDARPFHGRAYAALGDGYWRMDDRKKMREIWKKGAELFPADPRLTKRLSLEGEALDVYLDELFDTQSRIETHLRELLQVAEGRK